jgi:hypothetical protein
VTANWRGLFYVHEVPGVASKKKLKKDPYEPNWTPKRNEPPAPDQSPRHRKKRRKKPWGIKETWRSKLFGLHHRFRWYETREARDYALRNIIRKHELQGERFPRMKGTTFEKTER